ncbi:hypothetical protein C8J57DRAFT_1212741 [Mycena rebaudengoi]|nr:hypothetical protein C8J57DRAFT_1212741 [Mycena rebaudengoi]
MSAFARERIQKAHKGRETRGVLMESTERTVGSSFWSILRFFLDSCLLFSLPALGCLAVFASLSYALSPLTAISIAQQALRSPEFVGVASYIYVYWTLICTNISIEVPPDATTVFVNVSNGTIALTVTPTTTVLHIREAVYNRGYGSCRNYGPLYLSGVWRPLNLYETMAELGVQNLSHFVMPLRLRGGAHASKVIYNEKGWEQGRLNPDDSLKDAEDIDFRPDAGTPPDPSTLASGSGRPTHDKDQLFEDVPEADDKKKPKKRRRRGPAPQTNAKGKGKQTNDVGTDPEDLTYSGDDLGDDSDGEADAAMAHEKDGLPSKMVPTGSSRRLKEPKAKEPIRKRKKPRTETLASKTTPNTQEYVHTPTQRASRTRNPIWHFFTNITDTNHGQDADEGDKFYRCRHGESTNIHRITLLMRHCINGLTGHLRTHAPDMFRFYEILKRRGTPLTDEEAAIAEGKKRFPSRDAFMKFLDVYVTTSKVQCQQSLPESFAQAGEKSLSDWDQAKFECLLTEWLIACDQPFQEVERPEFCRLLEYVHHRPAGLCVPSSSTVEHRVTEMGKELEFELRSFFALLEAIGAVEKSARSSPYQESVTVAPECEELDGEEAADTILSPAKLVAGMQDWNAITLVSDWLLNFRSATSQMSTRSRLMLSSTHSTFRGLQRMLKDKLSALSPGSPPELVEGLTKAHRKLSEYYYKYDHSPFYIWAALQITDIVRDS